MEAQTLATAQKEPAKRNVIPLVATSSAVRRKNLNRSARLFKLSSAAVFIIGKQAICRGRSSENELDFLYITYGAGIG